MNKIAREVCNVHLSTGFGVLSEINNHRINVINSSLEFGVTNFALS